MYLRSGAPASAVTEKVRKLWRRIIFAASMYVHKGRSLTHDNAEGAERERLGPVPEERRLQHPDGHHHRVRGLAVEAQVTRQATSTGLRKNTKRSSRIIFSI